MQSASGEEQALSPDAEGCLRRMSSQTELGAVAPAAEEDREIRCIGCAVSVDVRSSASPRTEKDGEICGIDVAGAVEICWASRSHNARACWCCVHAECVRCSPVAHPVLGWAERAAICSLLIEVVNGSRSDARRRSICCTRIDGEHTQLRECAEWGDGSSANDRNDGLINDARCTACTCVHIVERCTEHTARGCFCVGAREVIAEEHGVRNLAQVS